MIKLLVFLSFCSFAFSLKCYNCDPTATGKCVDPVKANVIEANCDDTEPLLKNTFESRSNGVEYTTQCFQLHMANVLDNEVGVYRGCLRYSQDKSASFGGNICEYWTQNPSTLGDQYKNATISQCEVCNDDLCNKKSINGVAPLTFSFFTVLIMLCLFKIF